VIGQKLETALDLPEPLPSGETLLWSGRPQWKALAIRVFHLRIVLLYFVALALWRGLLSYDSAGASAALWSALTYVPVAAVTLGILALLAWLMAHSSAYAITNRRLIVRIGVAVPLTLNLPFSQIDSAALRRFANGTGDIPIRLKSDARLGYAILWPHARPWRLRRPQPMLRTVPDAAHVADILARAVIASEPAVKSQAPASEKSQVAARSLAAVS
jgi:hypothetical protein